MHHTIGEGAWGQGLAKRKYCIISQVTFIYIELFTIQIISKQLHSDNIKIITKISLFIEENCVKFVLYLIYSHKPILEFVALLVSQLSS